MHRGSKKLHLKNLAPKISKFANGIHLVKHLVILPRDLRTF